MIFNSDEYPVVHQVKRLSSSLSGVEQERCGSLHKNWELSGVAGGLKGTG